MLSMHIFWVAIYKKDSAEFNIMKEIWFTLFLGMWLIKSSDGNEQSNP